MCCFLILEARVPEQQKHSQRKESYRWFQVVAKGSPVDVCSGLVGFPQRLLRGRQNFSCQIVRPSSVIMRKPNRQIASRQNFARHPKHNAAKPSFYSRHQRWHFCRGKTTRTGTKSRSQGYRTRRYRAKIPIPPLLINIFFIV